MQKEDLKKKEREIVTIDEKCGKSRKYVFGSYNL
jgi:hypothetical protein